MGPKVLFHVLGAIETPLITCFKCITSDSQFKVYLSNRIDTGERRDQLREIVMGLILTETGTGNGVVSIL